MSSYHEFTAQRTTEPDAPSLLALLRAQDATIGVQHAVGTRAFRLKKSTPWLAAHITFAQTQLDTTPAVSARLDAKYAIENWPLELRALVLTLIDQINVLRAGLPTPLPSVPPAQALNAVIAKALTL